MTVIMRAGLASSNFASRSWNPTTRYKPCASFQRTSRASQRDGRARSTARQARSFGYRAVGHHPARFPRASDVPPRRPMSASAIAPFAFTGVRGGAKMPQAPSPLALADPARPGRRRGAAEEAP